MMNTNFKEQFAGIAERILVQSRGTPKYMLDPKRKQFSSSSKEVQLASYIHYTVNIERRL